MSESDLDSVRIRGGDQSIDEEEPRSHGGVDLELDGDKKINTISPQGAEKGKSVSV